MRNDSDEPGTWAVRGKRGAARGPRARGARPPAGTAEWEPNPRALRRRQGARVANPAGARVRNTACHGPAAFRPNVETASNRDPAWGVTAPGRVRSSCPRAVLPPRPRARCSAPRSPSACSAGNPWRRLRKPVHGPCWSVTRRGNRHRVGGFPSRPRSTHVGRGGARLCTPRQGGPSAPGPPPGQLLWPAPLQPDLLGREDRIGKAG